MKIPRFRILLTCLQFPGKRQEPRQEKQNSIILNETYASTGLTQQMQKLTIDDFDLHF